MMDLELSPDEAAFGAAARRVATEVLGPRAAALDSTEAFPHDNLRSLAELGFMGANLPEAYGGSGASSPAVSAMVEEVAAACAATCSSLTAHFLATDSILLGGTEEQRQRWLPGAAQGERLGAFALTEPGAGSNPAEIATRATRSSEGWCIHGTKHFITNGGAADFLIVFAKTDPAAGHRGISAFYVPRSAPGLTLEKPEPVVGIRASHIVELQFEDCMVPHDHLLGDEGAGFRTALAVLDRGRVEIAAMALGIARAAFEAARAWLLQRRVGGQPLAQYQGLQWMLADMYVDLEASRLLTYRAARRRDSGERFSLEAAVAKLFASEAAGRIADAALQMHGGYGYSREMPLERYWRDARILRIFEGTSEIQRNLIARSLLRA
jgi:alkylation response protein AidB-like acyl-CoA dehydrogenase